MEKNVNVYLFLYLIIFLEAYFCVSLFSTNIFPREYTKVVEKHLREDYGEIIKTRKILNYFKFDVFLSPSEEAKLKVNIQKYAGDHFIKEYENLMNEDTTDSNKKLAKTMINLIKQQLFQ
ncbi:hypothetical protein PFNF54_04314 [Plasmodium falciparum NF54]|uniref:Uncharacterized protein n=1 Tax=Plasmodium falciparum (isolate NF54) TaxID=5843 RepID=W7JPU4_PLAFO|nr:hypothetical protein PFNF54_04314 [Plasmodium falciparum NF54]